MPVKRNHLGQIDQVGLILRQSPFGHVWCHLGGRIVRGETVRDAICRHLTGTIRDLSLDISDDPQPAYVFQWLPPDLHQHLTERAGPQQIPLGIDPRKHAIGLSYVFDSHGDGTVVIGGEALEFRFYPVGKLPARLWPGCDELFTRMFASDYSK
ncbi:DUF4916 domain-containing protein [Rarobacter incanus]|uniref:DUF4916 domain-containing protein n=1 Tax=Rarobacter incanus TaxID=153494 RepID=UPI003CCC4840